MMTLESFSSELNLSAKLVPDEESRGTRANVVEVFGRVKCERTNQARDLFRKAGATVRFYNVDKNKPAAAIVNENVWWLVHGELPFIRVDGRPIRATTESCSRALQKM